MLDLEVAGSAIRSTLWDVVIVVLVVGMVVVTIVGCSWSVRKYCQWVLDREIIRRRLTEPGRGTAYSVGCTCYRCGESLPWAEHAGAMLRCEACREWAARCAPCDAALREIDGE
jgi:hypothetical protein